MDRGCFLAPDPPGVGRGARVFETVPPPAAGKEWLWTVPSGYYWRMLATFTELTASAQAATRFPGYQVLDQDGDVIFTVGPNNNLTAGKTAKISFVKELTFNAATESLIINAPFPDLLLPAGYQVGSLTGALQTEDKYSETSMWLEQWEDRGAQAYAEHERIELLIDLIQNGGPEYARVP
jgi:hypothetical protein